MERNSSVTFDGKRFNTGVNKLLVRMDKHDSVTKAGIVIPKTAKNKTDFSGEVVAVSPSIQSDGLISVGSKVLLPRQAGIIVPTDDDQNEYRIYYLNDIRYVL